MTALINVDTGMVGGTPLKVFPPAIPAPAITPEVQYVSTLAIPAPPGATAGAAVGLNAPSSPVGASTPSVTKPATVVTAPAPQATPAQVPAFFVKALGLKDASTMSPWELQVVAAYISATQGNAGAKASLLAYVPGNKSYDALPQYMKTTYDAANASLKTLGTVGAGAAAAAKIVPPAPATPTTGLAAIEHGFGTFLVWLTSKLSTRA